MIIVLVLWEQSEEQNNKGLQKRKRKIDIKFLCGKPNQGKKESCSEISVWDSTVTQGKGGIRIKARGKTCFIHVLCNGLKITVEFEKWNYQR